MRDGSSGARIHENYLNVTGCQFAIMRSKYNIISTFANNFAGLGKSSTALTDVPGDYQTEGLH